MALRAYVTDIAEFNAAGAAIGAAWGVTLGRHFPAMTLVQVSALIDPQAKVEIEGEAILPELWATPPRARRRTTGTSAG